MSRLLLCCFLFTTACASANKMSTSSDFMNDESYRTRKTLDKSFFKKESHNLKDKDIEKLLNSKITPNKNVKLAFFNLGQNNTNYSFDHLYGPTSKDRKNASVNKNNETLFSELVKKSKKVKAASIIPSFLMPQEITIPNLRDVAALIQANYLVILKSNSDLDYKFRAFSPNEAMATLNMEVAIVDVRSGAIPYTSLITGRAHLKKDKDEDFNSREFRVRALASAESAAFQSLTDDLSKIFNSNAL